MSVCPSWEHAYCLISLLVFEHKHKADNTMFFLFLADKWRNLGYPHTRKNKRTNKKTHTSEKQTLQNLENNKTTFKRTSKIKMNEGWLKTVLQTKLSCHDRVWLVLLCNKWHLLTATYQSSEENTTSGGCSVAHILYIHISVWTLCSTCCSDLQCLLMNCNPDICFLNLK